MVHMLQPLALCLQKCVSGSVIASWESKIDKHIPDDMAHHKPTNSYSNGHINTNIHGTYMLQPLALCLQKCVSGSVIATLPKSTRLQTT